MRIRSRADDAGPDYFEGQCEVCGLEAEYEIHLFYVPKWIPISLEEYR